MVRSRNYEFIEISGEGGNSSPSGRSSYCDRVRDPEPPSPLRGEGWDGGDKREGILGRFKFDPYLKTPRF